jgi:hypothetical protein
MSAMGTTEFRQTEVGGEGGVRFVLGRDAITCEVHDGRNQASLHHGWEDLAPPSFHTQVGRPDRWIDRGWTYSAIAMVVAPFILRDLDPLRVYLIVLALAALLVALLTRLRKPRTSGISTEIPVSSGTLPVLDDAQHDEILTAIESYRRSYLIGLEPSPAATLREHLAYLDVLREHEVIDAAEHAARRAGLAVDAQPEPLAETPPSRFSQKRIGLGFEYTIAADRVVVRDHGPFRRDTTSVVPVDRILGGMAGRMSIFDDRLAFVLSGWLGAPFLALLLWGWWRYGPLMVGGGEGWKNIVVFLVPPAVGLLAAVILASRQATTRLLLLDPGIPVLDRASARPIIDAITQSRRSALRRLAPPNPAKTLTQQSAVLERLLSEGMIDEREHAAFLAAAATVCTDPRLDQPVASPSG